MIIRRISKILKTSDHGFTLIELLIVVAIISILVSIGAVSFSRVQQQGRDTERKADLQTVSSALEQYHGDNSAYPVDDGNGNIDCGAGGLTWGTDSFCGVTKIYLNPLPEDPQSNPYFYDAQSVSGGDCDDNPGTMIPTCQKFVTSGNIEGTIPDHTCTPAATYNFCVNNP